MSCNIGRLRMETRPEIETDPLGFRLVHQPIQGRSNCCTLPPVGELSELPVVSSPMIHQVAHQHLLADHLQYNYQRQGQQQAG